MFDPGKPFQLCVMCHSSFLGPCMSYKLKKSDVNTVPEQMTLINLKTILAFDIMVRLMAVYPQNIFKYAL